MFSFKAVHNLSGFPEKNFQRDILPIYLGIVPKKSKNILIVKSHFSVGNSFRPKSSSAFFHIMFHFSVLIIQFLQSSCNSGFQNQINNNHTSIKHFFYRFQRGLCTHCDSSPFIQVYIHPRQGENASGRMNSAENSVYVQT